MPARPVVLPRTLVVIPTYNERQSLGGVVRRLLEIPDVAILVVDDRSPDGTGAIADALCAEYSGRVHVLHRAGRAGLGRAYIAGFRHALAHGADLVCQMDADGSHDPAAMGALLRAATSGTDVVIGSRYVPGGRVEGWSWRRHLLSRVANNYVQAVTGVLLHDATSGFRCWTRHALETIRLEQVRSTGYAFQVEMACRAVAAGLRVQEVPIVFTDRRHGTSKLSLRAVAESVVRPWGFQVSRPHRL